MVTWILAVLALFVVQTFLPNSFRFLRVEANARTRELVSALGPRDRMPPLGPWGERALRAQVNLQEALPVFLTLALLHVAAPTDSPGLAEAGAAVFFGARVLYVPSYVLGVFGVRSLLWIVGWLGLAMMIAPLVS